MKISIKNINWMKVAKYTIAAGFAVVGAISDQKKEDKFKEMEKLFDELQEKKS